MRRAFADWYLQWTTFSWRLLESEEHHTHAYVSSTLFHLEVFALRQ